MSDSYESKRDAASYESRADAGIIMGTDNGFAYESGFQAGVDWQSKQQQYYLHSDDNYYWTPAAWAEYQSLKAKLVIANEALELIGKKVGIAAVIARMALTKLNQPMSTEDKLATAVASEDTGYV